jgi:hypothetical protein
MVAGLSQSEELELALAQNRRYRAAIDIAVSGLSAARDNGFSEASVVIGRINDTLSRSARPARHSPPWPQLAGWARDLLHGRTRSR